MPNGQDEAVHGKERAFRRELKRFGQLVTCDRMISKALRIRGLRGECNAHTVKDVYSGMIMCYPLLTKSAEEATESLKDFKGGRKVDVVYSDNAGELVKATEAIKAKHEPSLPGIPKSNAIIERVTYLVRDGASASLVRAGLPS